ncbi:MULTISPECIES: sigma-70 family RNA polymerase sigma factor [unclassified Microbacterium]|uniref:sigma-70 family RNA polymerase sigma factor n=1 Tax=unclassified Microbacterium TaxID=2609290 RepID=UPI0012F9936B|nr:sigma-70 family RNA polymerase sigma factor [Microbacterium sp. MAH-37]MVQ42798.1 sigma-70 family RNA polymerase sigma factor [Microbacterium sp. MAH-37]
MTLEATPATRAWEAERGRLIGIAYRMLGDFGLAEDVVSDVAIEALKEERAGSGRVRSWPAWLTTVCVRRTIDRVRSLAASREEYIGHWLPEPVATSRLPEDAVADRELLSVTLLHLAEQLTPDARAAVVLHRAFGMSAVEIGEILESSPAAVRQLISRGERRLRISEDVADAPPADPAALAALVTAIEGGDISAVLDLLADDAILWSDGGGRVRAALNPIFGAEKVRRFFVGVAEKAAAHDPVHPFAVALLDANGEPALALTHSGRTDVLTLEFGADGRIHGIRQVSNPDKLHHVL